MGFLTEKQKTTRGCSICGSKGKMVVHHVDENYRNNNLKNMRILCYKCHNQLHGCGMETRFKQGHKVTKEIRMKISNSNKRKENIL